MEPTRVHNAFRLEAMQSTGFYEDDSPAGGKRTRSEARLVQVSILTSTMETTTACVLTFTTADA